MDKQDIQRIKSLILVMLICCMPVFCGCNDEDENHSIPQLEIAEEFLIQDFDNKKHDIEIPVITNLSKDEWRITSSAQTGVWRRKLLTKTWCVCIFPASEEPEVREAVVKSCFDSQRIYYQGSATRIWSGNFGYSAYCHYIVCRRWRCET